MTKAVPEQRREIDHRARNHGGPDPEDLGASGRRSNAQAVDPEKPQRTVARVR